MLDDVFDTLLSAERVAKVSGEDVEASSSSVANLVL